jgi:hypothetical protein
MSEHSQVFAVSHGVHVKDLIPVRVESLLDDGGCFGLLSIDCGHGEGIRES